MTKITKQLLTERGFKVSRSNSLELSKIIKETKSFKAFIEIDVTMIGSVTDINIKTIHKGEGLWDDDKINYLNLSKELTIEDINHLIRIVNM